MFVSARAIMGWLADCARVVSSDEAPVRWASPLGLPIMQPYHKLPMTNVATATQTFHVSCVVIVCGECVVGDFWLLVCVFVLCWCCVGDVLCCVGVVRQRAWRGVSCTRRSSHECAVVSLQSANLSLFLSLCYGNRKNVHTH